jgi:hypothetical protein
MSYTKAEKRALMSQRKLENKQKKKPKKETPKKSELAE